MATANDDEQEPEPHLCVRHTSRVLRFAVTAIGD